MIYKKELKYRETAEKEIYKYLQIRDIMGKYEDEKGMKIRTST